MSEYSKIFILYNSIYIVAVITATRYEPILPRKQRPKKLGIMYIDIPIIERVINNSI